MDFRQNAQVISLEGSQFSSGDVFRFREEKALEIAVAGGAGVFEIFLRVHLVGQHGDPALLIFDRQTSPVGGRHGFEIYFDDVDQVQQRSQIRLAGETIESEEVSVVLQAAAGGKKHRVGF